jgi:hypothetical protein
MNHSGDDWMKKIIVTTELDRAISEADCGLVETFDCFDDWAKSVDKD